ncbi:MFS transporter [Campylobacter sp. FMV-PI01]|uniref:MFS transporter n=1 Tax=Campylobacter portucalensis TaxID=2608384 RepID=A0A6L5WHQ7_9BACT|nr:MFS transporter [Campylobacter portucalensis]MSN96574.1 MFS transporter [Campylobacter portucalensis]
MNKYLKLLKSNKTIRILSSIQLICYFGAWFSHVGIFTLLLELKANTWMIGLSAAMAFIPSVIMAPFSGVIIDKFKAFPLFMSFMIIEAISVLMLLLIDSLDLFWLLQILIFIRMGVTGIYFQVEMSLLPKILNNDELRLANEIHSIIWALSYTLAMALAGFYIDYFGVYNSFLFDFILYLIGIFLLTKLNIKEEKSQINLKTFEMIKDGILYLKSNPLLLNLMIIHGFVAVTSYDTLISILAGNNYKNILSISLVIGLLNTFRAFGLIIGPIVLSKLVNTKVVFILFITQGIGLIIWALLQFNFYLSFIGLFLTGFSTSTIWSYTYTLVQTHSKKEFYGRVMAYCDMIFLGIAAITSILTGILYDLGLDTFDITCLFGLHFIISAFYYKRILNKI